MAKTTTNPFTQSIRNPNVAIVNGDSFIAAGGLLIPTNTKSFFVAGAEGSVLKSMVISSDDGTARNVAVYVSTDGGTTKYLLGTVNVPLNAGSTGAIVNVDVLNNSFLTGLSIDQTGRQVLPLAPNAVVYVGVITAVVTSGKALFITGVAEDF